MEENNEGSAKEAVKRTVTIKGRPMALAGEELKVGMPAPDFKAVGNDMLPMKFSRTYGGKVSVVISVFSVDSSVCDLEGRRFNKEAEALGPDVGVIVLSMDLPFAQKRWCGAFGVDHVKMLSDHRDASFGQAFGTLIKELRIMSRAIFVVGKDNVIRHVEYVKELGDHPNYDAALAAARDANA